MSPRPLKKIAFHGSMGTIANGRGIAIGFKKLNVLLGLIKQRDEHKCNHKTMFGLKRLEIKVSLIALS